MQFKDIFPPLETVLEMNPEELAPFVLKYLSDKPNINRYNFTLGSNPDIVAYAGGRLNEELNNRLMEAWMWLEKEILITPKAGAQHDWAVITRRGRKIIENDNFSAIKFEALLPSDNLDPVLLQKVKSLFIRGEYEMAIFAAFKEVEVRVRKKAGLSNSDVGVKLMRTAFGTGGGLFDATLPAGESDAIRELFSGAIGTNKNPSSHRDVDFENAYEVIDVIFMANHLLRLVERTHMKLNPKI